MEKGVLTFPLLRGWQQAFLATVLAGSCGSMLRAQDIRIRVVDGRNGHPLRDCVNILTSPQQHAPVLLLRTSKEGVALVRVGDEHAGTPAGSDALPCKDVPSLGRVARVDMIAIWPDWDVDCRPPDESSFLPPRVHFYPVEEILRFGVATGNTCGRLEVSAKPGELVLFVRPPHWWEAIRR